jgi:hypothetical protein
MMVALPPGKDSLLGQLLAPGRIALVGGLFRNSQGRVSPADVHRATQIGGKVVVASPLCLL